MSRYNYACSVCAGSVSKPETGKVNSKTRKAAGLGGWQCPKDGAVSVVRTLRKEKD